MWKYVSIFLIFFSLIFHSFWYNLFIVGIAIWTCYFIFLKGFDCIFSVSNFKHNKIDIYCDEYINSNAVNFVTFRKVIQLLQIQTVELVMELYLKI